MNRYAKMMLLTNRDKNKEPERRDYRDIPRNDYGPYVESKFRDRRGREHYDDGRSAPTRSNYDDSRMDGYPRYPTTVPPMYNRYEGRENPVNKIGFSVDGEMEHIPEVESNYRSDAGYHHMDEIKHRTSGRQSGHAEHSGGDKLDRQAADKWATGMVNTDGTTGAHWTRDQVKSLMDQHGIDFDLDEFWVVLNAVYSDYCGVAKKHNVNKMEFYIDMAKAWLYDADAVGDKPGDKVWAYYDYVVKH